MQNFIIWSKSFLFSIYYWSVSIFFGLALAISGLFSGGRTLRRVTVLYSKAMCFGMKYIAGIDFEYRGQENLPKGPYIIAAKHQSWGDGFGQMQFFGDVAFVTGDHLEKFPLLSGILKKIGAIVVDSCGGSKMRNRLSGAFEIAASEGRNVLIFPEGHLVKIGERIKYRSGVFHLQQACGWPIVPIATNLGLFWREQEFKKESGIAINEILPPIPSGLSKEEFMTRLEAALNEGSKKLCEEAQAKYPNLSQAKIKWPDEINSVR